MKTARKVLCANLPPCFLEAFNYIDSFKGIGHIDYAYLRKLFQDNCINLPNIRVNLELEPPSLKRTLSQQQKEKKRTYSISRRVSLQPNVHLLRVPDADNLLNSSSSNYSSLNTTQKTYFQMGSNVSCEGSEPDLRCLAKQSADGSLDECSSSQQPLESKLKLYSIDCPSNRSKLENIRGVHTMGNHS